MQVGGRRPQKRADAIGFNGADECAESSLIGVKQLLPDRPDFILIRDFQRSSVTVAQTIDLHQHCEAITREFA